MAAGSVAPNTIVPEALREGNYENWRTCIKRYLVAQDLWDVVKNISTKPSKNEDPETYLSWKKKNAKSLHAIQISCSPNMLSHIRGFSIAKEAWDFLAKMHNPSLSRGVSSHNISKQSSENTSYYQYESLIKALEHGNWYVIETLIRACPDILREKISSTGQTALHIATQSGNVKIVEKLVEKMDKEDLELKEELAQFTPLALACLDGFIEIAQCMIHKNPRLVCIVNEDGNLPVLLAAMRGKKDMTRFLYSVTPSEELAPEKGPNGATLVNTCIVKQMLDIALDILERYPRLAISSGKDNFTPIYVLAQMPRLFPSGGRLWFWQRWIYYCTNVRLRRAHDQIPTYIGENSSQQSRQSDNIIVNVLNQLHGMVSHVLDFLGIKNMHAKKLRNRQAIKLLKCISCTIKNLKVEQLDESLVYQAIIQAVKHGIVEFITEIIDSNPDLLASEDFSKRNIFLTAILHRQEKIFGLLHRLDNLRRIQMISHVDMFENNMLHLAGMLAPPRQLDGISGAALQMQRELQWFKEVESVVPQTFKDVMNKDGKKPGDLFTEQHASLMKDGEKWMKEIANSSTFVAALIVTIMFSAAFTVPGGTDEKTGMPKFLKDPLFMLFIISDAISLFSATTSVLMFLGIMTSQYAESKFLTRLPTKLIIGLSALFFSIAAMMISFSAALAIWLNEHSTKFVILPLILLASIPVTLFALLLFPLLVEIFISTYGPGIFDRRIERWY